MMNVLLLGAGASKAYTESPSGQKMPIACDFFSTFKSLSIYEHPWVLREALIEYISYSKQGDPVEFLGSGVDIEELHSEIGETYRELLKKNDYHGAVKILRPYNELISIFASVINAIQNGPISKSHKKIAQVLTPSDVIVTFNWDTLMDRALFSETSWNLDQGYGIAPQKIFRDGWQKPSESKNKNFTKLLKLHGSVNWITSYTIFEKGKIVPIQSSSPETTYFFEYATKPYSTYAGRYMDGYQPFSYGYYPPNILDDKGKSSPHGHTFIKARQKVPWKPEGVSTDEGLTSMPLIIPPVKNKTYDMFGSLFTHLWNEASSALQKADKIVIIGYSFPRTDHKSNQLFVDAFMGRKSIPEIVIVDPFPERIQDKFLLEFGIPKQNIKVHKEYFSEDFPIETIF